MSDETIFSTEEARAAIEATRLKREATGLPKVDEIHKAAPVARAGNPSKLEVDAFKQIRFVDRDGRKVKTYKREEPSKATGEKLLSEAVASVFAQYGVDVVHEDLRGKREQLARDQERRARGLPDLCDPCLAQGRETPLGMSRMSIRLRDLKGHPWGCRSCNHGRKKWDPAKVTTCSGCGRALSSDPEAQARREKSGGLKCSRCTAPDRIAKFRKHEPFNPGKPDHCNGCNKPLGMSPQAWLKRRIRGGDWLCKRCACQAAGAERTAQIKTCAMGHRYPDTGRRRCRICENQAARQRRRA